MLTLVCVVLISLMVEWMSGSPGAGSYRVLLPLLACVCVPWMVWLDLYAPCLTRARSPFVTAILYALAAPLYFGLLPFNIAGVIDLGAGTLGPFRFAVEFAVMLMVPAALVAGPPMRLYTQGKPRRPSMSIPAQPLFQALAVLVVGLLSLVYVAATGLNGIAVLQDTDGIGVWRQTVPIMVPVWYLLAVLTTFALAWGQVGLDPA